MPFNVNEFISGISSGAVAKTTNYEVIMTRGSGVTGTDIKEQITLRADSVTLPGRDAELAEGIYHYGRHPHMAMGSTMTEVKMTIILSDTYAEKTFIEEWKDAMLGPYRTLNGPSTTMYDVGYFDDYKGTVEIWCYDDTGKKTYQTKLIDAFPVSIGSIDMAWAAGEEIAKLSVAFTYTYYTNEKPGEGGVIAPDTGGSHTNTG